MRRQSLITLGLKSKETDMQHSETRRLTASSGAGLDCGMNAFWHSSIEAPKLLAARCANCSAFLLKKSRKSPSTMLS